MADNSPQKFTYNGVTAAEAARNPGAHERYLIGLSSRVEQIYKANPPAIASTIAKQGAAPSSGSSTVTGQDGVLLVTVSPTKDTSGATLFYQIQTSDTLNFDSAGNVITYGGDSGQAQTDWRIHEPNQSRYVRWRSKTASSLWSAYSYYILPSACGPFAVWSGVLRSISTALANSATTPSGGNPLTQDGTTTNIKVAASLWKCGAQRINYNPGNVNPGAYGKYYIFCDDPHRVGGTVIFQATTNVDDVTASDYRLSFGFITTAGGGGGTGGGGGGGGCLTADVEWATPDGGSIRCDAMKLGDKVLSIDGGEDELIYQELIPGQPCFSIATANGHVLKGASSTHLVKLYGGTYQTVFEVQVGDTLMTKDGPSAVTNKTFIGEQTVYKQGLHRTRVGFTDGIVSHNALTK